MKQLYRVEIEPSSFDMYVWASDAKEAKHLAQDNASSELDNIGFDCYTRVHETIEDADDVPEEYQDSLPYGEEEKTISELLTKDATESAEGSSDE